MSLPQKCSRTLIVDGHSYRWKIRSRPTYAQGLAQRPLRFAVELEGGASVLLVSVDGPRPDNWLKLPGKSVTPAHVAQGIRQALAAGWKPTEPDSALEMTLNLAEDL
jgi:hypothetical protein